MNLSNIESTRMVVRTCWGDIDETYLPAEIVSRLKNGKMRKDGFSFDLRTKSGRAAVAAIEEAAEIARRRFDVGAPIWGRQCG